MRLSWLDFKLGFRMLARYPGLTVVGGLALAFGVWIGACTFEASQQWLRPDLGLDAGDRVVGIQVGDAATGAVGGPSLRDYLDWRNDLHSVVELSAFPVSFGKNVMRPRKRDNAGRRSCVRRADIAWPAPRRGCPNTR